jgi:hypothetical protein
MDGCGCCRRVLAFLKKEISDAPAPKNAKILIGTIKSKS